VPSSASPAPPTPSGTPSTGYDAFLLHVPEPIRAFCHQGTAEPPPAWEFNVLCYGFDARGIQVGYSQYTTANGMDADYERLFAREEIDQDSGSCEDPATWPAESRYDVEGQPAGRRLCVMEGDLGLASITWTDDRLLILSTAQSASAVADPHGDIWGTQAGPIP
jgi:hypothetical protein